MEQAPLNDNLFGNLQSFIKSQPWRHWFTKIVASLINHDHNIGDGATIIGLVPVGSIIGWHKTLTGCPTLTIQFIECNGQTLSDSDSPFNGQVIPNLNGDGTGADSPGHSSKEQMFLRGGTTSGTGQTEDVAPHTHSLAGGAAMIKNVASGGTAAWPGSGTTAAAVYTSSSAGSENRPKNMSVVWIMRIK